MTGDLRCDQCGGPFPPEMWNRSAGDLCPYCRKKSWVRVFPAVQRTLAGRGAEAIGSEAEASCFYHPQSRAHIACDSCGRFVCGLCDLEVADGLHNCPACFEKQAVVGSGAMLDKRRVLYDSIALGVNLGGFFFFFWPSVITAPLSIVLALWFWRKPRSIVPRWTVLRFVITIVLGLAQSAMWFAIFWSMANRPSTAL